MVNTDIMILERKLNNISDDVSYLLTVRLTTPKVVVNRVANIENRLEKETFRLRQLVVDQDTAILRLRTELELTKKECRVISDNNNKTLDLLNRLSKITEDLIMRVAVIDSNDRKRGLEKEKSTPIERLPKIQVIS